jgi:hypothetical protein
MGTDTGGKMLSPDDLGPADVKLLELLNEGRVTAPYAAEETGYSLQYVRDRLARFVEHGNVTKVHEGLYELRDDPREGDMSGGRESEVSHATEWLPDEPPHDDAVLDAMDIPQAKDREPCRDAVYAVRDYLEEHGPASMREIVTDVMPDYPLGYDVPQLEPGDRYRGAWWRRIIQPGLRELDDVEYRENHSDYYVP